jgi:hypothetical protein
LDIVEHLSASPSIAADDVAMTAATQIIEVVLCDHAAVANEDHASEPEALLQVMHHIGHSLGIAPVTLKHMVRDWPTINHGQSDQHLRIARLVITAVSMSAFLRRSVPFEVSRREVIEHHIDLERGAMQENG